MGFNPCRRWELLTLCSLGRAEHGDGTAGHPREGVPVPRQPLLLLHSTSNINPAKERSCRGCCCQAGSGPFPSIQHLPLLPLKSFLHAQMLQS